MSDEREFYHLQELDDAAADWTPEGGYDLYGNAAGLDEYNARLIAVGRPAVTMTEYLAAIDPRRGDGAEESND